MGKTKSKSVKKKRAKETKLTRKQIKFKKFLESSSSYLSPAVGRAGQARMVSTYREQIEELLSDIEGEVASARWAISNVSLDIESLDNAMQNIRSLTGDVQDELDDYEGV
jgi:septation ring formation regulator EzrA